MAMPANPLRHYAVNRHIEHRLDGRSCPAPNEPIPQMNTEACVIWFSCNSAAKPPDSWKGSWNWDLRTDRTTWSEQLYWMVGRDRNEAVPCFTQHSCFYTSSSWDQLVTATLALLQTGETYELGLQMLHTDGTRRRVIATGEAVRDYRGQILQLCGTIEDISERKRQVASAERELQTKAHADCKATSRLVQAQEKENCNIATALRDNVCQRVSLLAAWFQVLNSSSPALSQETHMQLEELWRYTTETLCELDRISEQLHSSSLHLLGLTPAIESLVRVFERNSGVLVECSCTNVDSGQLGDYVAPALFRIVEESLDNIARHSRANTASVKLWQNSEEIALRVSDGGVGFERAMAERGVGVGFIRIKELVRQMKGSLAVWSEVGHGTSIEVRAPLNGSAHDEGSDGRVASGEFESI